MTERLVYLADITAYDPDAGAVRVLRYSTDGFRTGPADDPAHTLYDARIEQPISITRSIFDQGTTSGQSKVGFGDLVLSNPDGRLDDHLLLAFDGRPITIWRGLMSATSLADFTPIFVGTMEQAEFGVDRIVIKLRDLQAPLQRPLQSTLFAGSNALPDGLEGVVDDLAGKPKPLTFGRVFNITPPCVNTSRLIYQVHDGAISSIDEVRDRGVPLTPGAPYASLAELEDDGLAPAAGAYRVYLAGGYVRLGSSPAGDPTMDVVQGDSAADRTAAQLFAAILTRVGVDSGSIDAADLATLDAKVNAECGLYLDDESTVADVLDRVAGTVGAWWGASATGAYRIARLERPLGDTVKAFGPNDLDGPPVRQSTNDKAGGLPTSRVTMRYAQNFTVQRSNDLAGSVSDARRAVLGEAWREASAANPAVDVVHLLATPLVIDSLMAFEADARLEAERVLALRSVQRHRFGITVLLTSETAAIDLGDIVGLNHPRYGLEILGDDVGQRFVVLGVLPNAKTGRLQLTLWGSSFTTHNLSTDDGALFVTDDGTYLVTGSY